MLSGRTLLQLGLLRVVTWPGSRFKKQRIKAQILLNPPLLRDVLQSYVQLVRHECSPFRKDCDGGGSFMALTEAESTLWCFLLMVITTCPSEDFFFCLLLSLTFAWTKSF